MEMESLRYLARSQNALGMVEQARKTITKAVQAGGDSGIGWESAERVAVLIDHADFFIEAFQKDVGKDPLKDPRLPRARNYLDLAYGTAKRERMRDLQAVAGQRLAFVNSWAHSWMAFSISASVSCADCKLPC